jgi:hypothetical protein
MTMLVFHKLSAEVTASNGVEYRVTVEPAMQSEPGRWAIDIHNLDRGMDGETQYSNADTMQEALGVGVGLVG